MGKKLRVTLLTIFLVSIAIFGEFANLREILETYPTDELLLLGGGSLLLGIGWVTEIRDWIKR